LFTDSWDIPSIQPSGSSSPRIHWTHESTPFIGDVVGGGWLSGKFNKPISLLKCEAVTRTCGEQKRGWLEYFNPILGSKILSVFSKLSHEKRNGRSPYFQLHKKWGISWPADDKVTVSRVELCSTKLVRRNYVNTAFLNTVNKLASTKFINIAFIFYRCILLWYL